jgi:hypothetical protein
VTQLGSVFEGFESDQPRGPDLRVSIEVPREALGGPLRVRVPMRLAFGGDLVERTSTPDDPEHVILHLPSSLPVGAVLRLRGQGGVFADGQAGDLFVAIELVERAMTPDERVAGWSSPRIEATRRGEGGSAMVTWLILLGLALVATATVLVFFA